MTYYIGGMKALCDIRSPLGSAWYSVVELPAQVSSQNALIQILKMFWEDTWVWTKLCVDEKSSSFGQDTTGMCATGWWPVVNVQRENRRLTEAELHYKVLRQDSLPEHAANLRKRLVLAYQQVRAQISCQLDRQTEVLWKDGSWPAIQNRWLDLAPLPGSAQGKHRKLHRPWTGPFKVMLRISDSTYSIQMFSWVIKKWLRTSTDSSPATPTPLPSFLPSSTVQPRQECWRAECNNTVPIEWN